MTCSESWTVEEDARALLQPLLDAALVPGAHDAGSTPRPIRLDEDASRELNASPERVKLHIEVVTEFA